MGTCPATRDGASYQHVCPRGFLRVPRGGDRNQMDSPRLPADTPAYFAPICPFASVVGDGEQPCAVPCSLSAVFSRGPHSSTQSVIATLPCPAMCSHTPMRPRHVLCVVARSLPTPSCCPTPQLRGDAKLKIIRPPPFPARCSPNSRRTDLPWSAT